MEPRHSSTALLVTLSVIIAALIFGGGAYAYEKSQLASKITDQQSQIDSLKGQLAAATPTATANVTASPTPGITTGSCDSSSLKLTLTSSTGGAAAGTAYYDLVATNTGSATCTVSGFPNVTVKDSSGMTLGSASKIDGQTALKVSLEPGSSTYVLAAFPDPANFNAGTCKTVSTLTLAVTDSSSPASLALNDPNYPYAQRYCGEVKVGTFNSAKQ